MLGETTPTRQTCNWPIVSTRALVAIHLLSNPTGPSVGSSVLDCAPLAIACQSTSLIVCSDSILVSHTNVASTPTKIPTAPSDLIMSETDCRDLGFFSLINTIVTDISRFHILPIG